MGSFFLKKKKVFFDNGSCIYTRLPMKKKYIKVLLPLHIKLCWKPKPKLSKKIEKQWNWF